MAPGRRDGPSRAHEYTSWELAPVSAPLPLQPAVAGEGGEQALGSGVVRGDRGLQSRHVALALEQVVEHLAGDAAAAGARDVAASLTLRARDLVGEPAVKALLELIHETDEEAADGKE